jgi:hypothetical protein
MKMKMFYKNFRKNFSSSINPYHHDFHPGQIPESQSLVAFDFGRILLYSIIIANISINSLSYIVFRKRKFLNNPDFAIVDENTFLSLQQVKEETKK